MLPSLDPLDQKLLNSFISTQGDRAIREMPLGVVSLFASIVRFDSGPLREVSERVNDNDVSSETTPRGISLIALSPLD